MSEQEVWSPDGTVHASEYDWMKATLFPDQIPMNDQENTLDIKKALAQKGDQIMTTLKGPGDAWAGNLSPEEITQRGMDLAGLISTSSIVPKPGLGLFGGRIPQKKIESAEALEYMNFTPDVIKKRTGIERGFDTQWRQEFDDSRAKYKPEGYRQTPFENPDLNLVSTSEAAYLGTILHHPEFYKVYPEAQNIAVSRLDFDTMIPNRAESTAFYDAEANTIFLNTNQKMRTGEYGKSELHSLMHEVQHWVQHHSGFAMDTTDSIPQALADQIKGHFLRKTVKEMERVSGEPVGDLIRAESKNLNPEIMDELLKHTNYTPYLSLSSEVEARNAEHRLNLTGLRRKMTTATETEDIPRTEQTAIHPLTGEVGFGKYPTQPVETLNSFLGNLGQRSDIQLPPAVKVGRKTFSGNTHEEAYAAAEEALARHFDASKSEAGFMYRNKFVTTEEAKKITADERITEVAVRHKHTGKISADTGVIHGELIDRLADEMHLKTVPYEHFDIGYMTSTGRFIDREEALDLAKRQKQLTGAHGRSLKWGELQSEHVKGVGINEE